MKKVRLVSGHPNMKKSNANLKIVKELENLENVSVVHLISKYPDYEINAEEEIAQLIHSDVVVLKFPFHCYGVPAILKKWIDSISSLLVYGKYKDALNGKTLLISTTTGGPAESYRTEGYNKFTMKQLLLPLLKLGDSLGMIVLDPIVTHKAVGSKESIEAKAKQHALTLIKTIENTYERVLER